MNISKTAKAFAIAAVVGLTSQVFGASTNTWWSQDFNSVADMVALTNVTYSGVGQWSTAEGDESSIDAPGFEGAQKLKLDTQGSNLTWTPASPSTSIVVLVDADIYLVGSDSEPTGFDLANDVQTAVYLKNYIDDNNATTSSVLCAYVEDNLNNNLWVELEGVAMTDTNWYNVRIEVDYAASPVARFYVGGTLLEARGAATTTAFPIANNAKFKQESAQKVSSVSFRGTGAVDNFVGSQILPDQALQLTFDVSTFTDNVEDGVANVAAWSGATVNQGTQFWVAFNDFAAGPKYLTVVRVYTNATQYVDYDVNFDNPGWTLDAPLTYDNQNFGIRLDIDTTTLTEGYVIEAYYGADPSSGGNPDPTTPPVIGPVTGSSGVAFVTENSAEYFAVSFLAPEAGIVYSLQTNAVLGSAWGDVTDPLATATSESANEEITLKAPTGGATTMFFRVKASTAP